ncbi:MULTISPECIES: efflux RND transporter periplasmic adaptor subunit [Elizabethkingia]|uniref:Efflux transporter periplasmic adaptor subunit n=6 Tax=Elizabethkingia anophelis TaxID=1117645 RepID=X5K359_9FLAO|nr:MULTISPECIES: efflux RND transporter periplasmic adaptor subunit [Elizabethkingia]AIL47117.1 Membrane fusion efflux protein [Elizabethkingia anophelis NUHP1]AKH95659.1 transporter [Elizabethkingia anophelis FMS-007]AMR41666.1 efflux transporter periplasmic adaptor subunit [Elizabethkingia anophelis]AMX48305.1 efflux transporter periplasmic adaptor subunit [Elizabethkingia anophelis]AMX51765.1 efflux transporter periplasmic adaptor subunit [Elizabethkingia anophelis]
MKKKLNFKKIIYIILGIILLLVLFKGISYMISSNSAKEEAFLTRKPTIQTLEDKVLATGTIVPRREVEIKPNIPGIIKSIHVKQGDKVTAGQLIATINVVPSISEMNAAQQSIKDAELQIGNAKITLNNQQKQYDMQKRLFAQGVISKQEYYNAEQQYKSAAQSVSIAEQQLRTAEKRLQIARTGSTPELQSLATTQVRSKLNGTILEIPVKEGSQVIEANNFNAGTTICTVADLNSLIFKGTIDEAQAGRLKEGMNMNIIIGALQNKTFPGKLTLIAPKGKDETGSIKFPLEADVFNPNNEYIRAGFSANGEIIMNSQKNALLLDESLIQYEKQNNKDKAFVEVKQKDGKFKKVYITLGASDGINVQILSGITKDSEIKVWNPSEKDKEELKQKNAK